MAAAHAGARLAGARRQDRCAGRAGALGRGGTAGVVRAAGALDRRGHDRDRTRPPRGLGAGHTACACRICRRAACPDPCGARGFGARGVRVARPVHPGRRRGGVVRAAPARADSPLHGQTSSGRNRAGSGARFRALSVRVAAGAAGCAHAGRRCTGGGAVSARGVRSSGERMGNRHTPLPHLGIRAGVARRALPRRAIRVDAARRPHGGAGARRRPRPIDADHAAGAPGFAFLVSVCASARSRPAGFARPGGHGAHSDPRSVVLRRNRGHRRHAPLGGRGCPRGASRARDGEFRQLRRPARSPRAEQPARPISWRPRCPPPPIPDVVRHGRCRPMGDRAPPGEGGRHEPGGSGSGRACGENAAAGAGASFSGRSWQERQSGCRPGGRS